MLFSFLAIVLGAVALGVKGRTPGVLLMIPAVLGAILGGTLVAVFMVLALVGGILATVGGRRQQAAWSTLRESPSQG